MSKMTHEQLMDTIWKFIYELKITDDERKFNVDDSYYLVESIYDVRDALYSDLENNIDDEGEGIEDFFKRHGISWK